MRSLASAINMMEENVTSSKQNSSKSSDINSQNAFGQILKKNREVESMLQKSLINGNIEDIAPALARLSIDVEYKIKLLGTALSAYKSIMNMQI